MSDIRFAILTTCILVLAYIAALTVTSLERVLAYVGSTGSTSISFILPGLFYYKISDPNSILSQRLAKEDDDATSAVNSDIDDDDDDGAIDTSVGSLRSTGSGASNRSNRGKSSIFTRWRWRRKFRWDMEHISQKSLRRASLALAIYGFCVMVVCLALNLFGSIKH